MCTQFTSQTHPTPRTIQPNKSHRQIPKRRPNLDGRLVSRVQSAKHFVLSYVQPGGMVHISPHLLRCREPGRSFMWQTTAFEQLKRYSFGGLLLLIRQLEMQVDKIAQRSSFQYSKPFAKMITRMKYRAKILGPLEHCGRDCLSMGIMQMHYRHDTQSVETRSVRCSSTCFRFCKR